MAKKATKTAATKPKTPKPSAGNRSKSAAEKSAPKPSESKTAVSARTSSKKSTAKSDRAKKDSSKKPVAKKPAEKSKKAKGAKPAATKATAQQSAKGKKSKAPAKRAAPKPARPPRRERPKSGLQAAFEAALAVPDEPKRAASKLKPSELEEFRLMLLAKRAQLLGDVEQLRDEARANSRSESSGDLSSMPIHMADIGSDNWDQEFNLVLLQNERNLLREIDDALERINDGTYGICLATGRPIAKVRLRAKPWAKYCIEYARKKEIGHG